MIEKQFSTAHNFLSRSSHKIEDEICADEARLPCAISLISSCDGAELEELNPWSLLVHRSDWSDRPNRTNCSNCRRKPCCILSAMLDYWPINWVLTCYYLTGMTWGTSAEVRAQIYDNPILLLCIDIKWNWEIEKRSITYEANCTCFVICSFSLDVHGCRNLRINLWEGSLKYYNLRCSVVKG